MSTISASTTSTTAFKVTADTTGTLVLQTGATPTTAISIDASQAVTMGGRTTNPTTISVGAATPSTSGAGITFPATQNASANANTLDDYEEGTWTPVATVGFTIVGATVASGSYTKIGNLVQVTGSLGGATTIASAGGNTRITGMPFTSVSSSVCAVAFVLDDISFLSSGLFNGTSTGIYVPTFGATAANLVFQFSYRV
jgi:hypothetical protein